MDTQVDALAEDAVAWTVILMLTIIVLCGGIIRSAVRGFRHSFA